MLFTPFVTARAPFGSVSFERGLLGCRVASTHHQEKGAPLSCYGVSESCSGFFMKFSIGQGGGLVQVKCLCRLLSLPILVSTLIKTGWPVSSVIGECAAVAVAHMLLV